MMVGLAAEHGEEKTVMIDATYLQAHRTATSMSAKQGAWLPDWSNQGGMNTKLNAICDSQGRLSAFSSPLVKSVIASARARC